MGPRAQGATQSRRHAPSPWGLREAASEETVKKYEKKGTQKGMYMELKEGEEPLEQHQGRIECGINNTTKKTWTILGKWPNLLSYIENNGEQK